MKQWCATPLVPTIALIAIAGCSHGPADTFGERDAVPILAAKVEQKTVSDTIRAIGRVEAYSTVEVKAQINGQVMQVHFKEGQDVSKGDLLFTIDPRPFEAALNQAHGRSQSRQGAEVAARQRLQRYADPAEGGCRIAPAIRSRPSRSTRRIAATVAADEANVQTARLNLEYTSITSPIDGRTGNLHPA